MHVRLDLEEFFLWLASYSPNDLVGQPGRCFNSPLALFLSSKSGCVMGEDGKRYGRAIVESHLWRFLPLWAQVFASLTEHALGSSLSAYDAVVFLVQVETLLVPSPALAA